MMPSDERLPCLACLGTGVWDYQTSDITKMLEVNHCQCSVFDLDDTL